MGYIYCTCFNFTAVLFLFLSSPWGSVYHFLHSIIAIPVQEQKTQIEGEGSFVKGSLTTTGFVQVMERHGILQFHFPGWKSPEI